ncbi:MAG: methyltransferase domain-containing protein [Acidobacteria bacterium]|nr:MAG: methyltransferase domain-containing protein [Acidobacteriota bacterium]REK02616.1 MAG: methyltransferase domain-containing protein [Acidobacteriota bacterium]REK13581.1 MAG: methyltransferase domain-containing protein [Acidobacteriota bacterium]REK41575.1 MAG: methyltransferase domain-containing protein [Acidobacteriota bacterium]
MGSDSAYSRMDRMYRFQRHFYDASRKYYLLGRDRLISEMRINEGDHVLEVGCGTGRNLEILSKKYPDSRFYGLDASAEMLRNAERKKESKALRNLHLERALADDFSHSDTFDLEDPFDVIFFSYSISMIPTWEKALSNSLKNLRPGHSLWIVDFFDQRAMPIWFRKALQAWLKKFHVQYKPDLIPHLKHLEKNGSGSLKVTSLYKTYSFIAEFEKTP